MLCLPPEVVLGNRLTASPASPGSALEAYKARLKRHDWEYARSDCSQTYRAGNSELMALLGLRRQIDLDGSVWNGIAPSGFQVKPN